MTRKKPAEKLVETVPIDSLTPDPENARIHGRDNLKAITASLERFGQVRPLIVSADGVVVAGNGTLAAMQLLGWTDAMVVRLPWTDREQCRAYAIADNRTAELASWDATVLGDQVEQMTASGIPMDGLGFGFMTKPEPGADGGGGGQAEASRTYRCPACGFRWRFDDGGEVVPL
jgi:ParB-like chromosome segregation protein Spo0J